MHDFKNYYDLGEILMYNYDTIQMAKRACPRRFADA